MVGAGYCISVPVLQKKPGILPDNPIVLNIAKVNALAFLYDVTLPCDRHGSEGVVPSCHDGSYIATVQIGDSSSGSLLQFILHHENTQKS